MKLHKLFKPLAAAPFLLCLSCSTVAPLPALKIKVYNNVDSVGELYGFAGDKQILIDQVSIQGDSLVYDLNEKANTGVYRFVCGNTTFDFMYSGVPIDMEYDQKDVNTTLIEKNDSLNNLFISFQRDIEKLHSDFSKDTAVSAQFCDAYRSVFNKYMKNPSLNNTALYNIIDFLYLPDYQCYKNQDTHNTSQLDFMLNKYPAQLKLDKPEILVTPYLYPVLTNYLDYFTTAPDSIFSKAAHQLAAKASDSENMHYMINSIIDAKIHAQKRIGIMTADSSERCFRTINDGYFGHQYIGSGEPINTKLAELATAETNTLLVFFSEKTCPLPAEIADTITSSKIYGHANNLSVVPINADSLPNEVLDEINIYEYPSALLISQNGTMISRWRGKENIYSFIRKK